MSYAKVLGATSRKDGYLEGNDYLVSWCVGHLVELAPPNVYDANYTEDKGDFEIPTDVPDEDETPDEQDTEPI